MTVTLDRSSTARILFGLALGPAAIAALDFANPQWSSVELAASHFVNGRVGWLLTMACLSLAAGSAALIGAAAPYTRGNRAGLWVLGVWVVGMTIVGLVPADPPGRWDQSSMANAVHGLAALPALPALPVAAALLTRVWRRDPRWRRAHRALAVAAAGTAVAFLAFAVCWVDVVDGPSLSVGPYPTLVGLTERVMVWAYVAWLAVVVLALHRMQPATGPHDAGR